MDLDVWRRNFKMLRNNMGISQSNIALQLGKSQQTIGNWENGIGEPNIAELTSITNLFGISIDNFIKQVQKKAGINILQEQQANYTTPKEMVEILGLAVKGLDAANTLLQNKVTVLEKENAHLKKKK